MRIKNTNDDEFGDLLRRVALLESAAPGGSSSVTRGRTRFVGNESLLVQGSQKVEGWLVVTGTERVTGLLEVLGQLRADGAIDLRGPATVSGSMNVTGPTTLAGDLRVEGYSRLLNDLVLEGGGRIVVGPMVLDRGGAYGARLHSGAATLALSAGSSVNVLAPELRVNDLGVVGVATVMALDVTGTKNFRTDHPTRPGYWLRHGATESPVSGVEYWGDAVLDDDGHAEVELPEYFEALTKPGGRAVLVTGRGFPADWSDIENGRFDVTGRSGGRFSWLVKAERHGGDFPLEELIPDDQQPSAGIDLE